MTLAELGGQIRAGRRSFACEGEAADRGAQTRTHAVGRLSEEHDLSTAGQGHAVGLYLPLQTTRISRHARNSNGEVLYPGAIPKGSEPFWPLWLIGDEKGSSPLVPLFGRA